MMKYSTRRQKGFVPVHIDDILSDDFDPDFSYEVTWTENHSTSLIPVYDQYYCFVGTKEEVTHLLHGLSKKGKVFKDLNIEPYSKFRADNLHTGGDGHYHSGLEPHLWEDCPQNRESKNWNPQ